SRADRRVVEARWSPGGVASRPQQSRLTVDESTDYELHESQEPAPCPKVRWAWRKMEGARGTLTDWLLIALGVLVFAAWRSLSASRQSSAGWAPQRVDELLAPRFAQLEDRLRDVESRLMSIASAQASASPSQGTVLGHMHGAPNAEHRGTLDFGSY